MLEQLCLNLQRTSELGSTNEHYQEWVKVTKQEGGEQGHHKGHSCNLGGRAM